LVRPDDPGGEPKLSDQSSTPEVCHMKRLAVFGLVAGAVLAAVILAKKSQSSESSQEREARQAEKRRGMSQKMQACMKAMPDDFPPVMMFRNVEATRENSERILELLEEDRSGTQEPIASVV
jgi:succinate dehydrogenase/fumarate reductase flavoprotein subunit